MNSRHRRHFLASASATAAEFISPRVFAQSRNVPGTIKLVVPLPAGGAVDVFARKLAEGLAKALNTIVLVDNKPGAAGLIAARAVATAAPDGSAILYVHSGMVTAQAMGAKMDLLKEFRPVAKVSSSPHLLVVRADSAYKSVRDLLAAMKANPGKLNFGSGGSGSPTHLMYEMLEEAVPGVKATHVPFKGAIEAIYALSGGDLDFQFALPAAAGEMIKSGKLRALATTGSARFAAYPDLPTLSEAGAPGYLAEPWGGLMLPAKAPDGLVSIFADATFSALNTPDVTQLIERTGSVKAAKHPPAAFAEEIAKELTLQKTLVKKLGMVAG